jgi:hypothetical protein
VTDVPSGLSFGSSNLVKLKIKNYLLLEATLLNASEKSYAETAASPKPKMTTASTNSNQTTKATKPADNKGNPDEVPLLS